MEKPEVDPKRRAELRLTDSLMDAGEWDDDGWIGPPGFGKYFAGFYSEPDGAPSAGLHFVCPGCGRMGSIMFRRPPNASELELRLAIWQWDGNREKPTASPSILHNSQSGGCGWHGYLRAGVFEPC